jgi:hypothetical protein
MTPEKKKRKIVWISPPIGGQLPDGTHSGDYDRCWRFHKANESYKSSHYFAPSLFQKKIKM